MRPTGVNRPSSPDSVNFVYTTCDNSTIIDLYSVGNKDETWATLEQKEVPFTHWLCMHGPQGEIVRVQALFDGGAMVGAMCTTFFNRIQHRLHGQTKPSGRRLRMANGVIVPSQAVWKGVLELGGLRVEGEFEVFDSGDGWEFLFGKPLLHCFKALHDFEADTVTIRSVGNSVMLHNSVRKTTPAASIGNSLALGAEQQENSAGGSSGVNPPPRQVLHMNISDVLVQNDKPQFISAASTSNVIALEEVWQKNSIGGSSGVNPPPRQVLHEEVSYSLVQNDKSGFKIDSNVTQGEEYITTAEGNTTAANAAENDRRKVQTIEPDQEKQSTNQGGGRTPPSREVQNQSPSREKTKQTNDTHARISEYIVDVQGNITLADVALAYQTEQPKVEQEDLSGGSEKPPSRGVTAHLNGHHKPTQLTYPASFYQSPIPQTPQSKMPFLRAIPNPSCQQESRRLWS